MAVHLTIYPDDRVAGALRRFMTGHDCSATTAIELLLAREIARTRPAHGGLDAAAAAGESPRLAVA